jgi:Uma2 family endonuclease
MSNVNVVAERPRARISVELYQKLIATGDLTKDHRVELIEGDLLVMAPIGAPHAAVSVRITKLFVRGVGDIAEVAIAGPLKLGGFSEPQPDVMLLRPRADYAERIPEPNDVILVVEISDSTLGFDQTKKLALYARYGIEEYWVIDVSNERIHVYRNPLGADYTERLEAGAAAVISPRSLPQLRLDMRDLFGSKAFGA